MKFDILSVPPCLFPAKDSESCIAEPGGQTEDPVLSLRPEFATVASLGSVQFRTFAIANGKAEEITSGLTYRTSDPSIALIGAIGGNATGITPGIVTVSVEWQDMIAYAQLTVVSSCDASTVGMMILLDRSESMSQQFGGVYGTKLEFSKYLAKKLAGEVNVTKGDRIGLMTFSSSVALISDLTNDTAALASSIMLTATDDQLTDLDTAIQEASALLLSKTFDRRVIILLTDGYKTEGDDPVSTAHSFRQSGGIIMAIGMRSGLPAFRLLEKVANGGFFVSAYNTETGKEAVEAITSLKGYFCAGNCAPEGDKFVGKPQLNYNSFKNWDVTGVVDLIGSGLFDLIPGNGLYVDLAGSTAPWLGSIATKEQITLPGGDDYTLTFRVAGNQRSERTPYRMRVEYGFQVAEEFDVNDWRQDFTEMSYVIGGESVPYTLKFSMLEFPAGDASFGILLDEIKITRVSDGRVFFYDNFDSENASYVTPPCFAILAPSGYGYAYNDCYGYGCRSEPLPEQRPDPNPPPNNETMDPPSFTVTECYTASCAAGETGADVRKCVTYTSFISAADAHAKALALATEEAIKALNCSSPLQVGELINVDYDVSLRATDTGLSAKVGRAATGLRSDDFWNLHLLLFPGVVRKSDGSRSPHKILYAYPSESNSQTEIALDHGDEMYRTASRYFILDNENSDPQAVIICTDLEDGVYDVYVYAHGSTPEATGKIECITGDYTPGDPINEVVNYGEVETASDATYLDNAWVAGRQFAQFRVTIENDYVIAINVNRGGTGLAVINGLQIYRVS